MWPELLRQMQSAPLKCSIDSLVKKSASSIGCASMSAATLTLYKLANFIVICPCHHHLLPILCQRFFYLYLARIPCTPDEQRFADTFGVADKFYDANVALMKRLKKHFATAEQHFHDESLRHDDAVRSRWLSGLSHLYRSFGLWLEETRLNKMIHFQNSELPPQYDCQRLAVIFLRDETYWTEFVRLEDIRAEQKEAADQWLRTCFRATNTKVPIVRQQSVIVERANSKGITFH